jgi:hypothetical protein
MGCLAGRSGTIDIECLLSISEASRTDGKVAVIHAGKALFVDDFNRRYALSSSDTKADRSAERLLRESARYVRTQGVQNGESLLNGESP